MFVFESAPALGKARGYAVRAEVARYEDVYYVTVKAGHPGSHDSGWLVTWRAKFGSQEQAVEAAKEICRIGEGDAVLVDF